MRGLNVRAEARTYLRDKSNSNSKGKSKKQIPKGNDRKKGKGRAGEEADSQGNDRKKGDSNSKDKRRSRSLRDDSQKGDSNSKDNSKRKRRSRFPKGMTERNANATAKANTGVSPLRIMMKP